MRALAVCALVGLVLWAQALAQEPASPEPAEDRLDRIEDKLQRLLDAPAGSTSGQTAGPEGASPRRRPRRPPVPRRVRPRPPPWPSAPPLPRLEGLSVPAEPPARHPRAWSWAEVDAWERVRQDTGGD